MVQLLVDAQIRIIEYAVVVSLKGEIVHDISLEPGSTERPNPSPY